MNADYSLRRVQVLEQSGQVYLVAWTDAHGTARRCMIPVEEVLAGDLVSETELEAGIPYGLDLSTLFSSWPEGANLVAAELHRANIWTAKDILAHPREVQAAIQRAHGITFAKVLNFARKTSKGE